MAGKRAGSGLVVLACLAIGGCGDTGGGGGQGGGGGIDPTPERLDGSPSQEFEAEDIEAAENAREEVQEYCSSAASEAQEAGCLSHVDEGDIP